VPELPEVEVTRRQIEKALRGRGISHVETTRDSYFFLTPPAQLRRRLHGRRVTDLTRVGKYLLALLDDGSRLLLHLGMTGQLRVAEGASGMRRRDPHVHLVLLFDDAGPAVTFRDARKFGKVQWLAPGARSARLERLGVDALGVRAADLRAATGTRRAAIKSVLLDQSVLAGVGNIYADEALFLAGIRPMRAARRLTHADCERLARALRRVLREAIRKGGSSISDYVRPDGSGGAYQDRHRVYGRAGASCVRCRERIRRVVLGARSTCYCPRCQG
jgi:formamidopyrimidine-DNA glycosylase